MRVYFHQPRRRDRTPGIAVGPIEMPDAPRVGELVRIAGYSYRVTGVTWQVAKNATGGPLVELGPEIE